MMAATRKTKTKIKPEGRYGELQMWHHIVQLMTITLMKIHLPLILSPFSNEWQRSRNTKPLGGKMYLENLSLFCRNQCLPDKDSVNGKYSELMTKKEWL